MQYLTSITHGDSASIQRNDILFIRIFCQVNCYSPSRLSLLAGGLATLAVVVFSFDDPIYR